MIKAVSQSIKHFTTAAVLLLLGMLLAEVFLKANGCQTARTVTTRASAQLQPLLVPSATTHHEMRRLAAASATQFSFSTNSFGLRGDPPMNTKTPGTTRVLMLGDETVLGAHLEESETVSGRLSQFLANSGHHVEVINAGIPGFCPLLSWLQYEHELQKLNPDVVILHFDMTDVSDDASYRSCLKSEDSQQVCCNALLTTRRNAASPFVSMLCDSSLCCWFRTKTGTLKDSDGSNITELQNRYQWTGSSRTDLRLPIKHAVHPIQSFHNAAQRQGFRLIVSTSPVPWQTTAADNFPTLSKSIALNSAWPIKDDLPQRVLSAMCQKVDATFVDSTPSFRNFSQPSKLFLTDDCQLSNYGTALYAREIAAALLSTDFAQSRGTTRSVH